MRGALAIAALVGLLVAAPVEAATVRVDEVDQGYCLDRVVYEAAPGEFNQVHVQGVSESGPGFLGPGCDAVAQLVEFSEVYHPLVAGPGCTQVTRTSVVCAVEVQYGVADPFFFRLGDRDDLLSYDVATLGRPEVSCGPGIDHVVGATHPEPDCEFVSP